MQLFKPPNDPTTNFPKLTELFSKWVIWSLGRLTSTWDFDIGRLTFDISTLSPYRVVSIRRRFLHVPLQRPRSDLCPIDISLSVGGHAFGGAGSRRLFDRIGDEVLDGAVLCTPDTDAALPTIMVS